MTPHRRSVRPRAGSSEVCAVMTIRPALMKCCLTCVTDVVLLATLCCFFSSCGPRRPPECSQYDAFLDLGPTDQQRLEFLSHPLPEELEIYICCWYSEAAPRYLADLIADRGEEA